MWAKRHEGALYFTNKLSQHSVDKGTQHFTPCSDFIPGAPVLPIHTSAKQKYYKMHTKKVNLFFVEKSL